VSVEAASSGAANGTEIYYLDVTNSRIVSLSLAERTTRTSVHLAGRRGTLGRFFLQLGTQSNSGVPPCSIASGSP